MSKELLEEVKSISNDIKNLHSELDHQQADIAKCYFYERHGDWLIKQADRVQELKKDNEYLRDVFIPFLQDNVAELERQNKRYHEAREIIEEVYKESYVRNAYGFEDGFLDGLDTAMNIIDKVSEDEE